MDIVEQIEAHLAIIEERANASYSTALRQRAIWRRRLAALFDSVNILLSPAVHTQVPPIDDEKSLHVAARDTTRNTDAGAFGQLQGLPHQATARGGMMGRTTPATGRISLSERRRLAYPHALNTALCP